MEDGMAWENTEDTERKSVSKKDLFIKQIKEW